MAFSISINKLSDDGKFVLYEYGTTGKKFGKIKINKENGDTLLVEVAESDDSYVKAKRACMKLIKHWRNGEYPEQTYWAS